MESLISGIILIGFSSILFITSLIILELKRNKLRKLKAEKQYLNKKINIWYMLILFLFTPSLLIVNIILFTFAIINKDSSEFEVYKLIFNIFYMIYTIYILITLLIGQKLYKVMYIVKKEGVYYFLDNHQIISSSITAINNTLRRDTLIIVYLINNQTDTYSLKYNWKLKDWFNEN